MGVGLLGTIPLRMVSSSEANISMELMVSKFEGCLSEYELSNYEKQRAFWEVCAGINRAR